MSQPLNRVLTQSDPAHILKSCSSTTHLNIIFPFAPNYFKIFVPSAFPTTFLYVLLIFPASNDYCVSVLLLPLL
jgi:hypothetical protein